MIKINKILLGIECCVLVSCGIKTEIVSTTEEVNIPKENPYTDTKTKFSSIVLESLTTFPGVRSNLISITGYTLVMNVELDSDIRFTNILVEDISIPFNSLKVNEERNDGLFLKDSSDKVRLSASRMNYSNDDSTPQVHKEVVYPKTGQNLEGKAVVEYFIDDKPFYLEINEIKILPSIYAP